MKECNQVYDLRSALERLRSIPGQLVETDVQVDPAAELAGVYRHVGAGGTVMRPTRSGPAMLFNQIKGHPGARVAIGLLADRRRVAALLDSRPEELGKLLRDSVNHPVEPVLNSGGAPLCQQVVHRAEDPDFDLRRLVPAPTNTPDDAGPYITLGMCYASHPDTGVSDVTIHRLCLQGRDELSIFFTPGARHIGAMAERAEQLGQRLPISISIGVDPAIEIASCFEPPTTPLGFNELSIAGALRGQAVELAPCLTVKENCIANAEYVIEGEVIPGVRVQEDQNSHTGYAMPEFPGYTGPASDQCWLIKVKAVTTGRIPSCKPVLAPARSMCPWQVSPPKPVSWIWWTKPCLGGCRMSTAPVLAAANLWPCCNSRSRCPLTRDGSVRRRCWPSPPSPSSNTSSWWTRTWTPLT